MDVIRIPRVDKVEYDKLIEKKYVCRIAFQGEKYPYIAPFLYVFDGSFLYFLSTKYGKKIEYFRKSPYVSVEIEKYTKDLSSYTFVTLQGYLEEVEDSIEKKIIRGKIRRSHCRKEPVLQYPCRSRPLPAGCTGRHC